MKPAGRSLNEEDLYLFQEGTHVRLADVLGAHVGEHGVKFAVWAPRASSVSVVGSFNNWATGANVLLPAGNGLWQGFVEGLTQGERYKYRIEAGQGTHVDKADPVGFLHDQPPGNASVTWQLDYRWGDTSWMAGRRKANSLDSPISIYEVHLGSLRKSHNQSYIDIGQELVPYVKEMGFTHVEFMPVMEHPSSGRGGIRRPAIMRQPAVMVRPRISCS